MRTLLHISDIHTSANFAKGNNSVQLSKICQALIDDVMQLNIRIDEVYISGDITQSAKENEFCDFEKFFLEPIKNSLNIKDEFIFVCPGNHDVLRDKWGVTQKIAKNAVQEEISSADAFIDELANNIPWMENYKNFKNTIDKDKKIIFENDVGTVYSCLGRAVISINSAALSNGDDKGKLFIGKKTLDEISEKIKPFSDKIILMHHPIEWINENERSRLYSFITKNKIKFLFFGHMHEHSIVSEKSFNDQGLVKIQAGKFDHTDGEDYFTGYGITTTHEDTNIETGQILLRKFDSKSTKFKEWRERCDGEIKFSIGNAPPFNTEEFTKISESIEDGLEYDIICNVGCKPEQRKKLTTVFIDPNLTKIQAGWENNDIESASSESEDINTILSNGKSYILFGYENAGKSSILKFAAIKELKKQKTGQIDRMAFYIDCHGVKFKNGNNVLKKISDFYLNETNDHSIHAKIKSRISTGTATILIDSIDKLEPSSIKAVLEFISDNPRNKFILCASQNSRFEMESIFSKFASENGGFGKFLSSLLTLSIGGIKRKNIRQLVGRWDEGGDLTGPVKIRRYLENVFETGLGHNPFVYSILLSIYEKKSAVRNSYLHEADIVENFIEILLEKHSANNKNTPQYRDLILLLGYIAHKIYKNNSFSIKHTDLSQVIINFIRQNYQEFEISEYLSTLTQSGILKNKDGEYFFSQQCFYHYALAYLSTKSEDIYNEITDPSAMLNNGKTIEYIAAIKKNDEKLIHRIDVLCTETARKILNEAQSYIPPADVILSSKVRDCEIVNIIANSDDVSGSMSTEAIDDHDDEVSPLSPSSNIEHGSDGDEHSLERQLTELVSLHARTIKASEHLMSDQKTEFHFRSSVSYYDLLLSFMVENFFSELAPEIVSKLIEHIPVDHDAPQNIETAKQRIQRFLCFIASTLPNYISSMLRNDLLNNRSRLVAEKVLQSGKPSTTEELFVKLGLCDIDENKAIDIIKTITTGKEYVTNSIFMKLFELKNSGDIHQKTRDDIDKYLRKMSSRHKIQSIYSDIATAGTLTAKGELAKNQE